jgi:translation elongation factor P/translation initiation factor 5A
MDIRKGSFIEGDGERYLVVDTQTFRSGYKYICRRARDNAKVALDRRDVIRAIRSGDATIHQDATP